jgi:protein involved in polysaccharide export with SLBB domain
MNKAVCVLLSLQLVLGGISPAQTFQTSPPQAAIRENSSRETSDVTSDAVPDSDLPKERAAATQEGAGAEAPPSDTNRRLDISDPQRKLVDEPQPKGKKTEVLTDFQRMVLDSTGQRLPIFGRSLFESVPSTFAPLHSVPVTPDYPIGPGDELMVKVWGQFEFQTKSTVDRGGNIYLPRVGSVSVAGLRFGELRDHLRSEIARVFRNFDVTVNMGQLRSIQVFVLGHANRPGTYTVSSLSTLANALFVSGGPSAGGSMRRVRLIRGSQVVEEFDLYDMLLNGDKSKDKTLQTGDVILILPIGPLVALAGTVNNPGIYELRDNAEFKDVLGYAGGLSTVADGERVLVERIERRKIRTVTEFPLDSAGMSQALKDGDILRIVPLSPRFENAVTLRGNVALPGRYPIRDGMRIRYLIPTRETLVTRE